MLEIRKASFGLKIGIWVIDLPCICQEKKRICLLYTQVNYERFSNKENYAHQDDDDDDGNENVEKILLAEQ